MTSATRNRNAGQKPARIPKTRGEPTKPQGVNVTPRQAARLLKGVTTCKPAITRQVQDDIERDFASNDTGIVRRLGLATAVQAGPWFENLSRDREAAVAVGCTIEPIQDYVRRLRLLADILDTSVMRVRIALCRHADMEQILAEAAKYDPVASVKKEAALARLAELPRGRRHDD